MADDSDLEARDPLISLRFSTADFSDTDRIEAWRELFGRAVCQCIIEPLANDDFKSDVILRALPGLGVASGTCSGARYERTTEMISNDDLIFIVNHSGLDYAHLGKRDALVGGGEAVLVTTGDVCSVSNKTATRFTTMRIPRAAIANSVRNIDEAMVKPVPADNEWLGLLLNYVSILEDTHALATEASRAQVVSNVHELIASALGANAPARRARYRGHAAARLRAAKTYIRRAITSPELSIEKVAARHGLTARYLQMLFEREGTTLTEFIQLARLSAIHRSLRSERHSLLTIAEIASKAGFNEISYFNRIFRRHFGRTPSDVRNETKLRDGGSPVLPHSVPPQKYQGS